MPEPMGEFQDAISVLDDPRRELLDLLPAAKAVPSWGRRIYVHERSFLQLALASRSAAHTVYTCLALISVLKTIHHQIRHDGVYLGLIAEWPAERVLERLRVSWSHRISRWFHRLRAWARLPGARHKTLVALLHPDEALVASCYFSGYYTFATGYCAADLMYRDRRDIRELRRRLAPGSWEDDLALISCRLVSEEDELAGRIQRRWQGRGHFTRSTLPTLQAPTVRMEVLASIRVEAAALTADLGLTADERGYLCDRVDRALEVVFSRGILKTI